MENNNTGEILHLHPKTKYDTIRTTNHVLSTISKNMYLMGTNNIFKGMTKKQHEFMTFVLRGLQIFVNRWNNTYIDELGRYFADLSIDEKVNVLKEANPFLVVDAEELIPFLKSTTSAKFRNINKREALKYMEEIQSISNSMVVCQDIFNRETSSGTITSFSLFNAVSLKYKSEKGEIITVDTFDLLINPMAYESILLLFDALDSKGFGNTILEILLDIKSPYAKNLWFFISRFSNYIDRPKGNKYSTKLLYSVLSGEEKLRYQDLKQAITSLNRVLAKYPVDGEPVQLEIEPTKTRKNVILEVALRCNNLQQLINSYTQPVQRGRIVQPVQREHSTSDDIIF